MKESAKEIIESYENCGGFTFCDKCTIYPLKGESRSCYEIAIEAYKEKIKELEKEKKDISKSWINGLKKCAEARRSAVLMARDIIWCDKVKPVASVGLAKEIIEKYATGKG